MPPHRTRRLSPYLFIPDQLWRSARSLLIVSTLALAGCATTQGPQFADSSPSRLARDTYLSKTQSDPLGAYLSRQALSYPAAPSAQIGRDSLVATALSLLGTKYRYGGEAPSTGFDCSGLVIYAAEKSLGLKLPRRARDIAHKGKAVKRTELKRGDLVFFNTLGHRYSHVGIYLGNQKFVHAPRTGSVVRIEDMDVSYWRKRYNGARRLAAIN
ncbi:peptidoglycan endopeptidase [Allopusillimonas soli]|uniref:C40 family peptidase n=1 Tax=Allopusillimonas soli TaxID=659016 RepID=A0A853FE81_9BURK|nr:C40 family peptidase [Allopusillimonas soli]NYT38237.1 C40 family peptidase [Allopusillimonas soli]TEA72184.1 peptidoglycan endopeptidase [Allopusillimonas soli]